MSNPQGEASRDRLAEIEQRYEYLAGLSGSPGDIHWLINEVRRLQYETHNERSEAYTKGFRAGFALGEATYRSKLARACARIDTLRCGASRRAATHGGDSR